MRRARWSVLALLIGGAIPATAQAHLSLRQVHRAAVAYAKTEARAKPTLTCRKRQCKVTQLLDGGLDGWVFTYKVNVWQRREVIIAACPSFQGQVRVPLHRR